MPEIISGLSTQFSNLIKGKTTVISGVIENNSNQEFDIAIISEVIEPNSRNREMTQDAVDAVIAFLQNSNEQNIPDLLYQAVNYANSVIHEKYVNAKHYCTLAVALIRDDGQLFIANVGNSRVYLVRGNKLSLLSLDHSFKHVAPIQERMSPDAAKLDERADAVVLTVGENPKITVDLGLHLQGKISKQDYLDAQSRGAVGLPLKESDAVIVCSNSLIQTAYDGWDSPISEEELVAILQNKSGDDALNSIVNIATKRNPMIQPAAAILQMPAARPGFGNLIGQGEGGRFAPLRMGGAMAALITACVFLTMLACAGFFFLRPQPGAGTAVAQQPTETSTETPTETQTEESEGSVATETPSPTPTLEPTEEPTEMPTNTAAPTVTDEPTAESTATPTENPPTLTPTPIPTQQPIVTSQINLNMRGGPGTSFGIVAVMPIGEEFIVLQKSEFGNWYFGEIASSGIRGWVWADYTQTETASAIEAVPTTVDIPPLTPPSP